MIQAKHRNWARQFFFPYISCIMKGNFSHLYLANQIPEIPGCNSLLITPNHFTWWDGFFIHTICRYLLPEKKFHLMMLEEQLSRYWYFSRLGCFSMNPANTPSVKETLKYTIELLRSPDNLVVLYPQGQIRSYDQRPLHLKPGIDFIVKRTKGPCVILPVGFKINYFDEKYPEIIVRFGDLLTNEEPGDFFDTYRNIFKKNIEMLDEASYNRSFIKDLFNGSSDL